MTFVLYNVIYWTHYFKEITVYNLTILYFQPHLSLFLHFFHIRIFMCTYFQISNFGCFFFNL